VFNVHCACFVVVGCELSLVRLKGFCFPLLATTLMMIEHEEEGANFLLDACRRDLYFVFLLSRQHKPI
jgi:hypothetical protein